MLLNISFVGAGRVAGALCREMYKAGYRIDLIVSEGEISSKSLAYSCDAKWSTDLVFPDSSEVILVAVPDHKLESILSKIECSNDTIVAHTSGSSGLDIFPEHITRKGIFYPLQTFSKDRLVNFENLPFFLESNEKDISEVLKNMVESIGGKIHFADTEHRRMLHLSAVFACNFTNHMLTVGKELALKAGFSFEVLEPLIKETISKAMETGPEKSQTGPAIRNDQNTINKHIDLLYYSPELQKLYAELTQEIIRYYTSKDKR